MTTRVISSIFEASFGGEKAAFGVRFGADQIRILVSKTTDSSDRVIMGKRASQSNYISNEIVMTIVIIITLFQENNIFGTYASLIHVYGPQFFFFFFFLIQFNVPFKIISLIETGQSV